MKQLTFIFLLCMLFPVLVFCQKSSEINNPFRFCPENGACGYVDRQGNIVLPFIYRNTDPFSENLGKIVDKKNGFMGFVDTSGKIVIPCKYDLAYSFHEGLALVGTGSPTNRFYSFIDQYDSVVLDTVYTMAGDFSEGLAVLFRNGKAGYINKKYEVVIDLKYAAAGKFSEGLGAVNYNNKWGFIDKNGKMLIPAKFDFVEDFSQGLSAFSNFASDGSDGLKGYINVNGEIAIQPAFYSAGQFFDGIALVSDKSGQKYFWINKTAKTVSDSFNQAQMITPWLYLVKRNDKLNFYSVRSRSLLSDWALLPGFQCGLAKIVRNGRSGMINMVGDMVIPLIYDDLGEYNDGILPAKKGNAWGYINNYNQNQTGFIYSSASQLDKGLYLVGKNGKNAFLNSQFKLVTGWYDEVLFDENIGFIRVKNKLKNGLIDSNGKVIADCIYDAIGNRLKLGNDVFLVKNNGKFAYLNLDGRIITDWYDRLQYAVAGKAGKSYLLKNDGSILAGGYDEIQIMPKDSFYIFKQNNKFGFVNQNNGSEIPAVYDDLKAFAEGLAAAKSEGLWGYINRNGVVVIGFQFSAVNGFYNHLAKVTDSGGKSFYIDSEGKCKQGCE